MASEQSFDLGKAAVAGCFISIAGLIGAGKSTLCKKLASRLGLPAFHEPVDDNPYLELFYKDMAKYGFQLQVYLLTARFSQQQRIIWSEKGAVQDRSIYEDAIFAKMLEESGDISPLDGMTYRRLFGQMSRFMSRPTALVYLDLTPEESMERIRLRARGCEVGITLEYLTALHRHYEAFIQEISSSVPVIRVKYDKFYSSDKVADAVLAELSKLGTIRSVEIHEDSAPTAADVVRALDAKETAATAGTDAAADAVAEAAASSSSATPASPSAKLGSVTAELITTPSPLRQDPTPLSTAESATSTTATVVDKEASVSVASDLTASMEAATA